MNFWFLKGGRGSGEGLGGDGFSDYLSECKIPKKIYTLGTSNTEEQTETFYDGSVQHFLAKDPNRY
jgi:hypothetical protein